jgi:hypothetical protein
VPEIAVEDRFNGLESSVAEDKSPAAISVLTLQQGSTLTGTFSLSFSGSAGVSTTPPLAVGISAEDLRLELQRLEGVHRLEISRTNPTGDNTKLCRGAYTWSVTFIGHNGNVPMLIANGTRLNDTSVVNSLTRSTSAAISVSVVHPGYDANMKLEHAQVLSFAASLGAINRAISTLVFTPPPFYHGSDPEINVKVTEMIYTGQNAHADGAVASHKIAVTVTKSLVAPTLNVPVRYLSVIEDHELSVPGVVVITPRPDDEVLTMSLSAEAGMLFTRPMDAKRVDVSELPSKHGDNEKVVWKI